MPSCSEFQTKKAGYLKGKKGGINFHDSSRKGVIFIKRVEHLSARESTPIADALQICALKSHFGDATDSISGHGN